MMQLSSMKFTPNNVEYKQLQPVEPITELSQDKGDVPVATLLQLWAALGWETSPNDWPPAWLLPCCRGCLLLMMQRSGSRGAVQTTCLAALSTAHLNKRSKKRGVRTHHVFLLLLFSFSKAANERFDCYLEFQVISVCSYISL